MSLANLNLNIELLKKQLFWLEHSFRLTQNISIKEEYTLEEFDALDTLCSRFSRSIDFLVRKVFRSIDDVEFESQGTLIDVVNNAHKRELFEDINIIRDIKDIRNDIAHEYIEEGLKEFFKDVLIFTPKLMIIINSTLDYSQKYKEEN